MVDSLPAAKPSLDYEAIMRWWVANPGRTIVEGARFFQVSAGWFSAIVHSDLFQARCAELRKELGLETSPAPTVEDRIRGARALVVEKLSTVLETVVDADTIIEAGKVLLKETGGRVHVQQNFHGPTQNVFQIDRRLDAIQKARRNALDAARGNSLPVAKVEDIAIPYQDGVILDKLQVMSEPEAEVIDLGAPDVKKIFDEW